MQLTTIWPLALIGFSIIIGPVLVVSYLRSEVFPKSAYSVVSVLILTICLIVLQVYHTEFFITGLLPHENFTYMYTLLVAPAMFFYFGRFVISPDSGFNPYLLLCLLPCALPSLVGHNIALSIVFLIGAGYALWFAWVVFSLRSAHRQRRFEMAFAITITLMAVGVFAFSTFFPTHDLFVLFYSQSIGLAYVFVAFALIAIPDFVTDLFELARVKYTASTLVTINTQEKLQDLERCMKERQLFRDEGLTLGALASELELSSHQLSELLNNHLDMSFSNYIRHHRIEAAKVQLVDEPEASILAISMDVGFRSQSTFYAAFKTEIGISPGEFRKSGSKEG